MALIVTSVLNIERKSKLSHHEEGFKIVSIAHNLAAFQPHIYAPPPPHALAPLPYIQDIHIIEEKVKYKWEFQLLKECVCYDSVPTSTSFPISSKNEVANKKY